LSGVGCKQHRFSEDPPFPCFGAATDADADRSMILGAQFFVSPSDSVAIIAANHALIPQFREEGLRSCARSMPTSGALDLVAQKLGIPLFETPVGWKYFGNLMDSGNPNYFPGTPKYTPLICGEESFGTGACHVRERDGMWTVLAWLQILAAKTEDLGQLVTVEDVVRAHWQEYGRNYYARYDFENVDKNKAAEMMHRLANFSMEGEEVFLPAASGDNYVEGTMVHRHDEFSYRDPVDGNLSEKQGVRIVFENGSRIVFRLAASGVAGATVRMYLESYEPPTGNLDRHPYQVLEPLGQLGMEIAELEAHTRRTRPTFIT